MQKTLLLGIVVVLVAAAVAAVLLWNGPQDAPEVQAGAALTPDDTSGTTTQELTPEQSAAQKMQTLKAPTERIAHLDWVAEQPWARSNLPILRTTIISDPEEAVQLHALETALELASREEAGATSGVVRTSLASTKGNTRARGLKAAREHPDTTLVPELIELVDNNDPYATMALNALAYTNSTEAHAKVLAVAEDENAVPKLRERALYLLAVTKDPEAWSLLNDLVDGEDEHLRKVATTVLRLLNDE